MFISEKILEKIFKGRSNKEAYLLACKWLSSNIIAVNNSNNITYKFEKVKNNSIGEIKLIIYITIDADKVRERHCTICEEVSSSFFLAKNKHMCESCKLLPYERRISEAIKNAKNNIKEVLNI